VNVHFFNRIVCARRLEPLGVFAACIYRHAV
jgi:hypothetical protein